MADPTEPGPYEDVNQAVSEEWVAETTPYERIREVISRVYTATDAATVVDSAATSPKTARKHLTTLADDGFISTETGPNGATLYRRSAESLVVDQAADILSQVSTADLQERISEMRAQLAAFRHEYGVESPAELTVGRTNELLARSERVDEPDEETIRERKTTRRNIAFANAALSIANAKKFVDTDSRSNNEPPSFP